jgi:hypothetical protein
MYTEETRSNLTHSFPSAGTRVAFFREKKIILQNTEQTEIYISSFGIPSVSRNGKRIEFRFEPFHRRRKSS